jgi:hypothetical protein
MQRTFAATLAFCVCACGLLGQSSNPAPLITDSLDFSDAERFWSDLPTDLFWGPAGCASDGSIYIYSVLDVRAQNPLIENTPMQLEVIEPSGRVQTFDSTLIDDLTNLTPSRSYDVGENDVDFLVSAIAKKNFAPDPQGKPSHFVARFNREGQYQGATELLLPKLNPLKLAAYPNGDLLIFAADESSHAARLLRYSLQGRKATLFEPDAPFATINDAVPLPFPKNMRPSKEEVEKAQLDGAVLNTQMVHLRDAILLLQMNAGSPLFETYANGSIRTIDLPKVEGFTADSLIPSDAMLYVRYRRKGTTSGRGDDALILEVNPSSGEEVRRILPGNFPVWNVACVQGRLIRAFRANGRHDVHFRTATLP